ncbi:tetratricopeptide repeat protein [Chryseobacterium lathyri]|uniref:YesN/AraC family two-component response regulator n=1 Tax=Chryseobacterium lathyri TaxID=395933 RepID=A0ABT9SMR6_9FLAO|nr:tetratricopeptide repeat protein [Chryseobacterium lathyri]MDP9959730.1 YesN/AraC family two-component response regulator [Chryseobacterium lathyri]MDQ0064697.1 YesN/AraC family two-component response regulator [Chryseobacterium lathyri]
MMKNTVLLLFYFIFGLFHAQLSSGSPTNSEIDSEIVKAEELYKSNLAKSIELSNEIYRASKKIDYKKGILESGTMLMARYFDAGNYKKVIDLSTEAEKLALDAKDNAKLANIYRLRASSYTELGFNNESIREFRKALTISEKASPEDRKNYLKALIYTGISSYLAHVNAPLDSIIHYQKKCLQSAVHIGDSKDYTSKKYHLLALSYMNLGMTSVAASRINDAENYFEKALKICQNKSYSVPNNLEISVLNEYAWLYYDQKKYDQAVQYAEKAEQLEKVTSIPYVRRDIYEVNFKSYVELGEKEASKKYMNLYTKLNDSLVNEEKKSINTPVKKMMDEQGEVHTGNIQKILMLALILIILLVAGGIFFWKRNQKKLHESYETVISNLKKTNDSPTQIIQLEIPSDKSINITDETVKMILAKLEKFEKSQKFIKKDLSLTSLATDLNTNTRYLSEIIKQYKKNSYNNYINGLRISYITNKLYENPIYREYKISYLAEACGFSSREVFAVIFKKETGVSPSYFINNLKKDSLESAS